MISSVDSNVALQSMVSAYAASAVSEEEVAESSSSSTSTVSNQDTYTPSADAIAYLAEESVATVSEESSDVVGDITTEDVTTEDVTTEDVTTEDVVEDEVVEDVEDVEDEVVEEEVEEEEDVLEGLESLSTYSDLSGMDLKLTLMANNMNTFVSMLSALNADSASDNLSSLHNESWVSDSSTFSYAGRYLAKTAAGTTNVQLSAQEEAQEEAKREIEYNNYSMTGYVPSEGYETSTDSE